MNEDNNKTYSVSVVIPTYNNGKYLKRALDSVLAQNRRADETIVVDDGSTDETKTVAAAYGDKICYIYQPNTGANAARNAGIAAAKYEWIALLDSDDEWLPDFLWRQIELLKRNPDLLWTTGNYYRCLCDEGRKGPHLEIARVESMLAGKDYFYSYFTALLKDAGGWTGTMVIKKEALERAGLFRVSQIRADDIDMWLRIAYRWNRVGYLSEPLAIYHLDIPDSVCRKYADPKHYDICEFIQRHISLSKEHNQYDSLEPFLILTLRHYIRRMLFNGYGNEAKRVLNKFSSLFRLKYIVAIQLLATFPRLTRNCCLVISQIVRKFNLRRRVVRRPTKG